MWHLCSKLKHAKVKPAFKNEDEPDPNNYRPISLLCLIVSLRNLYAISGLKSIIDKNDTLNLKMALERTALHSTLLLILLIKYNLISIKKSYSCGIFADLKKAFDTVDHDILFYYMALSHKDWELPNSRILLTEMDIDRGLDFPLLYG